MSIREVISCGSCSFFENRQIFGKPCKELGHLPYSRVCASYSPNVYSLRKKVDGTINPVISLIRSIKQLTDIQAETMAYLLVCQSRIKRYCNFMFLQPVYYKYCGRGNYLNHYCQAYVLDCTKDEIRLINREGTIMISIPVLSKILTVTEFATVKADLIANDKINDPNVANQDMQTIEKIGREGVKVHKAVTQVLYQARPVAH